MDARGRVQLVAEASGDDGAVRLQPPLAGGGIRLGQELGGQRLVVGGGLGSPVGGEEAQQHDRGGDTHAG
jgi:hypothetical protein